MKDMEADFTEIAHSGGVITLTVYTHENGSSAYQVSYRSCRPNRAAIIQLWALYSGLVLEPAMIVGLGDTPPSPPVPGAYPVFIGSDSQGKFGHNCPSCLGYWRSGPWAQVCPYCGIHAPSVEFLSNAHRHYVQLYCDVFQKALELRSPKVEIDMDSVADATGLNIEKPAFYISDESQQCKFNCSACNEFNDILGRYGYCSNCGTRNDLIDFTETLKSIRDRLISGTEPSVCLCAAVSAFDSFVSQYAKQLVRLVPLTKQRKEKLSKNRFHNFLEIKTMFSDFFDIDIMKGLKAEDLNFLIIKFLRRHVYEHNGGEADEKYLRASGDNNVREKQRMEESPKDIHKFLDGLMRVGTNLHTGFHELIPPLQGAKA